MNHIKSLAGQTAVYGISSILGRLINYLLVPLHTMEVMFSPDQLGEQQYFYSFAAFLLVLYTHGMETTFFRFSVKGNPQETFNKTFTSILIVSALASALLISSSDGLASLAGYAGHGRYVQWMALIILIDAITAIPFARLRRENKAKRFAILKLTNILINFFLQITLLLGAAGIVGWLPDVLGEGPVIDYIFLANLAANIVLLLLLLPQFKGLKLQIGGTIFREMFLYALPILLTGIAGTINEQLDRLLIKGLLSTEELGIYAQSAKLALFIQLAVQAFRYAGEPFFFNKAEDKNARAVFADVLYYFTVFAAFLFIAISFNIDLIGNVMLTSAVYRTALFVVPVIMFGKLFNGIYINLAVWFKIKDKTIYGTWFTLLGSGITITGNLLLIPRLGFMGSALTIVATYFVMCVACYLTGRKYFPVPYRLGPMSFYLVISVILVWLSFQWAHPQFLIDSVINMLATLVVGVSIWVIEKNKLQKLNR